MLDPHLSSRHRRWDPGGCRRVALWQTEGSRGDVGCDGRPARAGWAMPPPGTWLQAVPS